MCCDILIKSTTCFVASFQSHLQKQSTLWIHFVFLNASLFIFSFGVSQRWLIKFNRYPSLIYLNERERDSIFPLSNFKKKTESTLFLQILTKRVLSRLYDIKRPRENLSCSIQDSYLTVLVFPRSPAAKFCSTPHYYERSPSLFFRECVLFFIPADDYSSFPLNEHIIP